MSESTPSNLTRRGLASMGAGTLLVMGSESSAAGKSFRMYVSSFAAGGDGGISLVSLDGATGRLSLIQQLKGVPNPFFLAVAPRKKTLYAISAPTFGGEKPEGVAAFRIGSKGRLERLNEQTTQGTASCYLHVDQTEQCLLVANYTSGSVGAYPLRESGEMGPMEAFHEQHGSSIRSDRQASPHAHCILTSPDNRFAYAADLGMDCIHIWNVDPETADLRPRGLVRTAPGVGPRHLTFHPAGPWLYVVNELANSVTRFVHDRRSGMIVERETVSTLPDRFSGVTHCADVRVTPDGRALYATNRGHDSLAAYRLGAKGELLDRVVVPSRGGGPQNIAITPDGRWLICANLPSNNLAVFALSGSSPEPKPVGEPFELRAPSCIRLVR